MLFRSQPMGAMRLDHGVVMAPLTRYRSTNFVPPDYAALYYGQRATRGGLLITEATGVLPHGTGNSRSPGIWTQEQMDAWRRVSDAVHAKGGYVFMQLWHRGRAIHGSFLDGPPHAPSAIRNRGQTLSRTGESVPYDTPVAMTLTEINKVIEAFVQAAANARQAGMDGVELHGANGYLLDQFLETGTNTRTDAYGGSVENRCRLLLQVAQRCAQALGPHRVGVRLSPWGLFNDMHDDDPITLYNHVLQALDAIEPPLAYVHVIEPAVLGGLGARTDVYDKTHISLQRLQLHLFRGIRMVGGNFDTVEQANAALASGWDMVSFGRWFISNPDLAHRLRHNLPLAPYDRSTFYTPGCRGYTDYPPTSAKL